MGTIAAMVSIALGAGSADSSPAAVWARACVVCHAAGGPTIIDLSTQAGVLRHRGLSRALLLDGTMPPSISHAHAGPLAGLHALQPGERDLLLQALSTRQQAAKAFAELAPPPRSEPLVGPSLVGRGCWTVPARGGMQVRTMLIPIEAGRPHRIRGISWQPEPGTPIRMLSFAADPARLLRTMEATPGEPLECMGNAGAVPSGALGAVTRTMTSFVLPDGWAMDLPPGDLAIEVTAEPAGRAMPVRPSIRLLPARASDSRTISAVAMMPSGLELAPGACEERVLDHATRGATPFVGAIVKGGAFLRSVAIDAIGPTGAARPLLAIPDLRMALVQPLLLETPLQLADGDIIRVTFGFDNSIANPQQPHDPPRPVTTGMPPEGEDATVVLLLGQ
ncbi:MAG: hypothetical protein FJ270_08525 [Planctomycetes bacterium]|nr:hypothetical protein [Planctomycetota bacterium]